MVATNLERRRRPERAARAHAVEVPDTDLLAVALPRVDFADAFAVIASDDLPADPQAWADAIFHAPPPWVRGLLGLREAVVGLVGIERAGSAAFAPMTRTEHEVLLGIDQQHLDFRASVLREPGRVVLTTVVMIHHRRGRAYWALVRRVHPTVVRSMLARGSVRLAEAQDA